MSNQIIFYTQVGSIVLFVSALFVLYRLLVQQKDATIEVLKEKNTWLQDQLESTTLNSPDVLADRLSKRIAILNDELKKLSEDHDANRSVIQEKEAELASIRTEIVELQTQIVRAQEVLEEAEYFKEQFGCPTCGAEVTTLAGEEEEYRSYACGYTYGPSVNYPCPHDLSFPKLDEYDFDIRVDKGDGAFISKPKPMTKNAHKLPLQFQSGATEEEVRRKIQQNYDRHKRKL